MDQWLESLLPWGSEVIVWAQAHSSAWLDTVLGFITALGYEEFYLILFGLVYWCIHKQIGMGMAYLSMLSAWVNSALKYLFDIPRPSDPRIVMRAPRPETSPSFPSGQAQNAVANWGYLALRFRGWLLWTVATLLILAIGVSRVVLGVHYPQDVIGGWLIGVVLLVLYALAAPRLGRWLGRQKATAQVAAATGLPLLLIFLHPAAEGHYPAEGAITPMAALFGLGLGLIMERAAVRFRVEGPWTRRAVRFLVGLAVLVAVYAGPKLLIPEGLDYGLDSTLRFARYVLVGWTGAFLCPWLFVRLKLAESEPALKQA